MFADTAILLGGAEILLYAWPTTLQSNYIGTLKSTSQLLPNTKINVLVE